MIYCPVSHVRLTFFHLFQEFLTPVDFFWICLTCFDFFTPKIHHWPCMHLRRPCAQGAICCQNIAESWFFVQQRSQHTQESRTSPVRAGQYYNLLYIAGSCINFVASKKLFQVWAHTVCLNACSMVFSSFVLLMHSSLFFLVCTKGKGSTRKSFCLWANIPSPILLYGVSDSPFDPHSPIQGGVP